MALLQIYENLIYFGIWSVHRLEIKQMAEGIHHVPGLVEAQVHSMNEVWEVLQTGSSARAVGSTNANEHSSRSHWCTFPLIDKPSKFQSS